ncbi:hypothetical protein [Streptomyces sp. NPDC093795]|uniref:hypothetical protein n=1 Tax=Streptomyces sp. NPDC093795 TaxID=3366051 RepID=UPI00380EF014
MGVREAELRDRVQQLAASAGAAIGDRIVTEKVSRFGPDELRTLAHKSTGLTNAVTA